MTPAAPIRRKQPMRRTGFMKRSPMRRQSAKARARQRRWNAIVKERMIEVGGACEVRLAHCQGNASEGHHRLPRGRGGKDTKENCVTCCSNCHLRLHLWPKEAEAAGFLLSGKVAIQP